MFDCVCSLASMACVRAITPLRWTKKQRTWPSSRLWISVTAERRQPSTREWPPPCSTTSANRSVRLTRERSHSREWNEVSHLFVLSSRSREGNLSFPPWGVFTRSSRRQMGVSSPGPTATSSRTSVPSTWRAATSRWKQCKEMSRARSPCDACPPM